MTIKSSRPPSPIYQVPTPPYLLESQMVYDNQKYASVWSHDASKREINLNCKVPDELHTKHSIFLEMIVLEKKHTGEEVWLSV